MRAITFLLCAAAVIVGLVAGQNSTEAPSRVSVAATIAVPGTAFAQILGDNQARSDLSNALVADLKDLLDTSDLTINKIATSNGGSQISVDFTAYAASVVAGAKIGAAVLNLPSSNRILTATTEQYRRVSPNAAGRTVSDAFVTKAGSGDSNVDLNSAAWVASAVTVAAAGAALLLAMA
jgi:hypothetical protein